MGEYVGLDVSMEETSVCVLSAAGEIVWEGKVATEPGALVRVLHRRAPTAEKVGLETGPLSTWLWHALREADVPVVCLDARHAQAALSMRINKTDRNDAAGLAQLVRMGWYREVKVKRLAAHVDGALLASRALLVQQRCELENQIRGLLKNFGLRVRATKGRAFGQSVADLSAKRPVVHQVVMALLAAWSSLRVQIAVRCRQADGAGLPGDDRRSQPLSPFGERRRLPRPDAAALCVGRDRPDGSDLALWRCADAQLSLRGRQRHADARPRIEPAQELGHEARQARGLQKGACRAGAQDGGHPAPHVA